MIHKIKNQLASMIRSALRPAARSLTWLAKQAWYIEAKLHNQELYAPVRSIPSSEIDRYKQLVFASCLQRSIEKEWSENWQTHIPRMFITYKWLSEILPANKPGMYVLELGGESVATDLWRADLPHVQWQNTDFDLRFPWPLQDGLADVIVATEVVEHLSDQPGKLNEGFYQLGFRAALRESLRVLKPGGFLLITTPNAASIVHLDMALKALPPWFYPLHVREYTLNDVMYQLQNIGFAMQRKDIIHCLTTATDADYTSQFMLLLAGGYPVINRGDDLFILARKPD